MTHLIDRLPQVAGTYTEMISMARHTWFKVGGPAEIMFTPADPDDLARFLAATPADIPLYTLGQGSNLLVRDGGIKGVVIHTDQLTHHHVDKETLLVGAGMTDVATARLAARHDIAGLEFLIGIPGTIGGGLRMNAGAFGSAFKDVVLKATAIDRQGQIHHVSPDQMNMSYRHNSAPDDWIFIEATLLGQKGHGDKIRQKMKEIIAERSCNQPQGVRTGGSTFANPEGNKAWQLISSSGCRGLKHGAAMVSEKHCNFLINTGKATAAQIEELGETVRERVERQSSIRLRWEIRRVGEADGGWHG